ncbi:BadM/Rrf2 family transcriptional regulator [Scopulibacillus darangshiensis]|uniref:BadM/Rrf2 family transcriptional regulator n=1 Tax=Scopulibacillus darangshiensis TaxID=442528 RepID=A0A4R2P683_9BACL|nr:Rrf2 family transcriptional regulator [Scopulibacillus darangshiensis]TCP29491.1 BadM/Rrf2 family transcriptional regulator [Scopulibacillus darangshiensis]
MKNNRLAVSIHILSLAALNPRDQLTSEFIAGSVQTNSVVIRRLTSELKKAGLLTSQPGIPGIKLTRSPSDISLLDIYKAIQGYRESVFSIHQNPNPDCEVGANIQSTLDATFHKVQETIEEELANQTLQNILDHLFE